MRGYWWNKGGSVNSPAATSLLSTDLTIPMAGEKGVLYNTGANAVGRGAHSKVRGTVGFYRVEKSVPGYKVVLMFPALLVNGEPYADSKTPNTAVEPVIKLNNMTAEEFLNVVMPPILGGCGGVDVPSVGASTITLKFNRKYVGVPGTLEKNVYPLYGETGTYFYTAWQKTAWYYFAGEHEGVTGFLTDGSFVIQRAENQTPGIYFASGTRSDGYTFGVTSKRSISDFVSNNKTLSLLQFSYLEVL